MFDVLYWPSVVFWPVNAGLVGASLWIALGAERREHFAWTASWLLFLFLAAQFLLALGLRRSMQFLRPYRNIKRWPSPFLALPVLLRLMTCFIRSAPDFCIVGAEKAGTTSLYSWISQHPSVLGFPFKETHYWVGALGSRFSTSTRLYRSYFPTLLWRWLRSILGRPFITGECSPDYLLLPYVARCLRMTNPNMKIIVLLRDPVARAYSSWRMRRQLLGAEFPQALEQEEALMKQNWAALESLSNAPLGARLPASLQRTAALAYLKRGHYAEQLRCYLAEFPASQVLVVRFEELASSPTAVLRRVFDFLEIPTDVDMSGWNLSAQNQRDDGAAPMSPELRQRLEAHFAEANADLESIVAKCRA